MIRAARRASLLVAFYLLISAATAYAECAWVLWQEQTHLHLDGSTAYVTWVIVEAMSEETCRAQVTPGKVYPVDPATARATFRKVCLPDTIDPRGPKTR